LIYYTLARGKPLPGVEPGTLPAWVSVQTSLLRRRFTLSSEV
jgi:hypothetical protein